MKNSQTFINKYLLTILLGLLFVLAGWLTVAKPVFGQGEEATFDITLVDLGYSTTVLNGPSDSVRYLFTLPANWQPLAGTSIDLYLDYRVVGQTDVLPGSVEIRLNDEVLHIEDFYTSVITSVSIEIPPGVLRLTEEQYTNDLELIFSVPTQCDGDYDARLTVESLSEINFVYEDRPISLNLANYPKPFYDAHNFETSPLFIVLPSEPEAYELESAAMIAANLGAQTRNQLPLEVYLGDTLPITVTQQNLLLLGSPERMPLLEELDLSPSLRRRDLRIYSQMPASIISSQSFSYTLFVENTSPSPESLLVEDQISPLLELNACQLCDLVSPTLLHWNIDRLAPGQIISTVVQVSVLPDQSLNPGDVVEHTATLFDDLDQIVNVDTLTTTIAVVPATTLVSSSPKKAYFFELGNQAIPETDGVVSLQISPWNDQRVVLAVTGLNEAAVKRAADSLAVQSSMPGMNGQIALVQATHPLTANTTTLLSQDLTLADLGYGSSQLVAQRGWIRYNFEIPQDTLVEQAFLALHSAHGQAVNSISTTLEISLNGLPIQSIELIQDNAVDNWLKAPLPSELLRQGSNQVELSLVGDWPTCMDAEERNRYWLTIFPDSFFHLPNEEIKNDSLSLDLNKFPKFLTGDPGLQDVALLLPSDVTSGEVKGMVQLLSFLGNQAQGEYFNPKVAISSVAEPDQWLDYHLILVGQPSRNPYIPLINENLPQPFIPGRDEIRQQIENVVYRLLPGYDLGYIQLLPVPWDQDNAMLVVTGTTDEGLLWALDAVSNNQLLNQMEGNLAALVSQEEVHTTDTRQANVEQVQSVVDISVLDTPELIIGVTLTPTATPTPAVTREAMASPIVQSNSPTIATTDDVPPSNQPSAFLMGLFVLSILVVVVSVGITIWRSRS